MTPADFLALSIGIGLVVLAGVLTVVLWRMIEGPRLVDRVAALDLSSMAAMGLLCLVALRHQQPVYLDIAIAISLTAFLATLAFARYVQERDPPRDGRGGGGGGPA